MDDNTTTEQTTAQTGAEQAQPVTEAVVQQPADAVAASEPSESQQDAPQATDSTATEASAPQVDDKLQKFAKSQGLELGTPSEIKAATIAMKAQGEATRNYQRASELEKTVTTASDQYAEAEAQQTGQDPELLKTVRAMQVQNAVRDFWDAPLPNGERPDRGMEQAMISELAAKPYLAGDLEALYATAMFKQGSNADSVRTEAKRETLEQLAQTQQAAVPRGNAVNGSIEPSKKDFKDLSIAEMESQLGFVRQ